ncbi:MAG: hypothetical protein WB297_07115 [Actinomycetota bacterium]
MEAERDQDSESLEDLARRGSDELAHEEQGDAAIDRLIANIADRQRPERSPEPHDISSFSRRPPSGQWPIIGRTRASVSL